jgi:hypothetical protein
MLKSFTINHKLWFIFISILLGYLALLIVAFSHEFSNEFIYKQIQDTMLPMKQYCQNAEHAYFKQLSYYNQALTYKDETYLDDARKLAIEAEKSLLRLQKMNMNTDIQGTIQKIIKHYEIFTANAYHKFRRDVSLSKKIQSPQILMQSFHDKQDMFSEDFEKNKQLIQNCFKDLYQAFNDQISQNLGYAQKQSQLFKIIFLVVSIFFALMGYYFVKNTIKKSILFRLFDIQNFISCIVDLLHI